MKKKEELPPYRIKKQKIKRKQNLKLTKRKGITTPTEPKNKDKTEAKSKIDEKKKNYHPYRT